MEEFITPCKCSIRMTQEDCSNGLCMNCLTLYNSVFEDKIVEFLFSCVSRIITPYITYINIYNDPDDTFLFFFSCYLAFDTFCFKYFKNKFVNYKKIGDKNFLEFIDFILVSLSVYNCLIFLFYAFIKLYNVRFINMILKMIFYVIIIYYTGSFMTLFIPQGNILRTQLNIIVRTHIFTVLLLFVFSALYITFF
jgi:hypothetical protein